MCTYMTMLGYVNVKKKAKFGTQVLGCYLNFALHFEGFFNVFTLI